jgi:pimeloyl-ACP methyl ester carboxylesterase
MSDSLCSVAGTATAPFHTVLIPGLLCSARLYEQLLPAVWVTGLALISTSARSDSPEQVASRREQARAVSAGRFDALVDAVYSVLVDAGNIAREDLADFWRTMAHEIGPDVFLTQLAAVMTRPDSRPDLASIRCPTAVVHGTGDQLIAPENAVEIADTVPDAQLTLVPDAGHMIAQEQPSALAAAVGKLLEAVTL